MKNKQKDVKPIVFFNNYKEFNSINKDNTSLLILGFLIFNMTLSYALKFLYNLSEIPISFRHVLLIFISVYYFLILIYNKFNIYSIRSVILNITLLLSTYNLLLSSNLFETRMSEEYIISDIFLFYLVFLIVSFNYKLLNKLYSTVEIFVYLMISYKLCIKKHTLFRYYYLTLIGFIAPIIILCTWLVRYNTIFILLSFLMFLLAIPPLLGILLSLKNIGWCFNNMKSLKSIFEKHLEKIRKNFSLVFSLEPLMHQEIKTKDAKSSIILIISSSILKFFPFVMLMGLQETGLYYNIYKIDNNGYCIEPELINTEIRKLPNQIILVYDKDFKGLHTTKCTNKDIKINFTSVKESRKSNTNHHSDN